MLSLIFFKEISSLAGQISRCYAVNRRSENPFNITLSNFSKFKPVLESKYREYEKWAIDIFDDDRLKDLDNKSFVYLTSESENLLEDIDNSKIYIIGGLVDRNRHKGVTFKKASRLGIETARLPVKENIKLNSSCVLTVVHVLEVLLAFREHKNWHKALCAVIPPRKLAIDLGQNNE